MKTPEELFWQAAETLAAEGIYIELVEACCRTCGRSKADQGTVVVATEKDNTLNPSAGWADAFPGIDPFEDWLDWEVPDGWGQDLFLGTVAEHLRSVGFEVEVPEGEWQAIKVSLAVAR
jgi:hypothetical protein